MILNQNSHTTILINTATSYVLGLVFKYQHKMFCKLTFYRKDWEPVACLAFLFRYIQHLSWSCSEKNEHNSSYLAFKTNLHQTHAEELSLIMSMAPAWRGGVCASRRRPQARQLIISICFTTALNKLPQVHLQLQTFKRYLLEILPRWGTGKIQKTSFLNKVQMVVASCSRLLYKIGNTAMTARQSARTTHGTSGGAGNLAAHPRTSFFLILKQCV